MRAGKIERAALAGHWVGNAARIGSARLCPAWPARG